mgnify:CR=1 FL=1
MLGRVVQTDALARGMVDSIGTLESLIARLSENKTAMYGGKYSKGAIAMTPQEQAAAFAAEHPEAARRHAKIEITRLNGESRRVRQ